jgi:hypothetical protein
MCSRNCYMCHGRLQASSFVYTNPFENRIEKTCSMMGIQCEGCFRLIENGSCWWVPYRWGGQQICIKCDFEAAIGAVDTTGSTKFIEISHWTPVSELAANHYYNVSRFDRQHLREQKLSVLCKFTSTRQLFARAKSSHAISAALLILLAAKFGKSSLFGAIRMDATRLIAKRVFNDRFAREWLDLDLK